MESSRKIKKIQLLLTELEDDLPGLLPDEKNTVSLQQISSLLEQARQAVCEAGKTLDCHVLGIELTENNQYGPCRVHSGGMSHRRHKSMLSLLENSIDAVYRRDMESDRYDYLSPVIEQITGFSVAEMVSMKLAEVMERIHPDDRDAVRTRIERGKGDGKGIVAYRFKCKDGDYRWLADSINVQTDRQGSPQYCLGVLRDISEQKQMEQSLRESEERFRLLAENIDHVFWFYDLEQQRMLYVNPAFEQIWGVPTRDIYANARLWLDYIHQDDRSCVRRMLDQWHADTTDEYDIEYRIVRPDNEVRWIWDHGTVIGRRLGRPCKVCGIAKDITERKRAEEKLIDRQQQLEELTRTLEQRVDEETRKNREKDTLLIQQSRQAELGEMIAIIAHQWRQPLNTIGLYAQLLAETCRHGELDIECLDSTVKGILDLLMHMSNTIEDFRNFLKPVRDKRPFDIRDTITRTYTLISASFKQHNILVDIEGDGDVVVTDSPNEYAQVVMNILNNARDVLVERQIGLPRIKIRVTREGNRSVTTIADNAGGIAEELLDRIFEPFFTTKEGANGTGIGLYMSKVIVEKSMQGSLSVKNTTEGAEFRIEV